VIKVSETLPEVTETVEPSSEAIEGENENAAPDEMLFISGDQEVLNVAIKSLDADLSSLVSMKLIEEFRLVLAHG
jgi:hypothetical protein